MAVELLQTAVGDGAHVENIGVGTGTGPDFRIDYLDDRVGIGEVTWHEDPLYRAMWQELLKREPVQQLALAGDIGQWSVHLWSGAHIGRAYEQTPGFLERFAATQGDNALAGMTLEPTWPIGPLADEARHIGIESFHRFSMDSPALAVMQPMTTGGVLRDDPNIIVDWIDSVVVEPRYRDLTEKLQHLEADERHIFVVTGSATRYEVDHLFHAIEDALPTRDPAVPSWISHVWVMSLWGADRAIGRWERDRGWSAAPQSTRL